MDPVGQRPIRGGAQLALQVAVAVADRMQPFAGWGVEYPRQPQEWRRFMTLNDPIDRALARSLALRLAVAAFAAIIAVM
jgi:hypothetical protein